MLKILKRWSRGRTAVAPLLKPAFFSQEPAHNVRGHRGIILILAFLSLCVCLCVYVFRACTTPPPDCQENPPGHFHGLVDGGVYWVYVTRDDEEEKKDKDRMKQVTSKSR